MRRHSPNEVFHHPGCCFICTPSDRPQKNGLLCCMNVQTYGSAVENQYLGLILHNGVTLDGGADVPKTRCTYRMLFFLV